MSTAYDKMGFDCYEYELAEHWASAIINDDTSGLEKSEIVELNAFLASVAVGKVGHWEGFDDDDAVGFASDEISGLLADCYTARFIVKKIV